MNKFFSYIKNDYFNFNGRVTSDDYIVIRKFYSIVIVGFIILFKILPEKFIKIESIIFASYLLITFIPMLSLSVRRLHDIGKKGTMYITYFVSIPVVAFILFLLTLNSENLFLVIGSYFIFISIYSILIIGVIIYYYIQLRKLGDNGPNEFGEDPY
jgi:uncharacterized membrane protein YhaH (DUF805 family)